MPTGLEGALKRYLKFDLLVVYAKGCAGTGAVLAQPGMRMEEKGYRHLLNAIFGKEESGGDLLYEYMLTIYEEGLPVPRTLWEAQQGLAAFQACASRECVKPRWEDGETKIIFDATLKTLTPREEEVIRSRFGIERPQKTLDEIGVELNLMRDRVRQIENKALRKLRHGSRKPRLEPLVQNLGRTTDLKRELVTERERLNEQTVLILEALSFVDQTKIPDENWLTRARAVVGDPTQTAMDANPTWFKSVDEMELSVRTANLLQNTNIRRIGQIIQLTGAELYAGGFGRKAVNELREVLADMGLQLGTAIPAELQARLPRPILRRNGF